LHDSGFHIAAVVTAPDKPAGRGRSLHMSPVKEKAIELRIPLLQPINLRDPVFLEELYSFQADLQVVVAFRMLPEAVWNMPSMGTFNLHASLLPQYRGAAPINHAIINGETVTGLTTFLLNHEIDTGKVLFQEKIEILPTDNAGTLHDRMAVEGASLVVKTADAIWNSEITPLDQDALCSDESNLRKAPKIFKENCRINWNQSVVNIHNTIRGLSPYPAAFSMIEEPSGERYQIKIFQDHYQPGPANLKPGRIETDHKSYLAIQAQDGVVFLDEVQQEGKKRLSVNEFLRGFRFPSGSFFS
jgi:methionyl-tRNA formyltransferase